MKDAVARAIARMRDADWFREQCARAPVVQQQLREAAKRAGLRVERSEAGDPGPSFAITIALDEYRDAELVMDSSVTFFGYVIADMFSLTHHVRIANAAPTRLYPFLDAELREAPTTQAAHAQDVIVKAFRDLGWTELSREEQMERVPTRRFHMERVPTTRFHMSVLAAFETDPLGWVDGTPAPDQRPTDIVGFREMVAKLYGQPEADIKGARSTAPWQRPVEKMLLEFGRVQRLTPDNYPSVGWTIDFGDVCEGTFHARFLTDVYVSKVAPVWFWTHRFIAENTQPAAVSKTIEWWSVKDAAYTTSQQRALDEVRRALTEQNMIELEPYFLRYQVAPTDDSSELRTIHEWLFRDPRRLADPAPRLEEEHPDREVRVRRGGLRD